MKLLLDQNLSFRLCKALDDIFPGSSQVKLLGLDQVDDRMISAHAKSGGFVLVSQDSDFAEMAALLGAPPKVIWLRCGNQPTSAIAKLLRRNRETVASFGADDQTACIEIY